tara:strand:- start:6948 stop:7175 length:228 start_codon:yes stop_codon:yes gene_type:complete
MTTTNTPLQTTDNKIQPIAPSDIIYTQVLVLLKKQEALIYALQTENEGLKSDLQELRSTIEHIEAEVGNLQFLVV